MLSIQQTWELLTWKLSKLFNVAPPDRFRRPISTCEDDYTLQHQKSCTPIPPEIQQLVDQAGYAIDESFLSKLSFLTSLSLKAKPCDYHHGRVLYSTLRQLFSTHPNVDLFTLFETGTARGFSSICMAKASIDSNVPVQIITLDVLPHHKPIYWNSSSDVDGKYSRHHILSQNFNQEYQRITFLTGWTHYVLTHLHLQRIHFAFLDGQHSSKAVLEECNYVKLRQLKGDQILLDDVLDTSSGSVGRALSFFKASKLYDIALIRGTSNRGYALLTRR